MLVELVFVTTRNAIEPRAAAVDLLQRLGFRLEGRDDTSRDARSGKKHPAKAKRLSELPHYVRLEFDRGQVTFAALIHEHRKAGPNHRDRLLLLARLAQSVLAGTMSVDQAGAELDGFRERIEAPMARRKKFRERIIVAVLLLIIVLIIVVAISNM